MSIAIHHVFGCCIVPRLDVLGGTVLIWGKEYSLMSFHGCLPLLLGCLLLFFGRC